MTLIIWLFWLLVFKGTFDIVVYVVRVTLIIINSDLTRKKHLNLNLLFSNLIIVLRLLFTKSCYAGYVFMCMTADVCDSR